ncbi:MAG TPA: L,D-transpeptidase family protein [Steroidobacteraceae bacterium]|nr:L,D-transpeptidase family protein [Steroidobacteraceae bacterium]
MNRLAPRLLLVAAVLTLVAACTPFESLWRKLPHPGEQPESGEPATAPLPLAQATHRFVVSPGQDVVGRLQVTNAYHEDTFADIARRFNVGYQELVRANPGIDPWLPGAGTPIVLPTEFVLPDAPREGLVLNLAAMRLYYYPKRPKDAPKDGPAEVYTHPIGIGKVGWATPEGTTKVMSHVKDPVWTPPLSVRKEHEKEGDILPDKVPPGPENPLGRHMMRLGWPSYLIHGTNKPPAVGMRASAGCIRLYPEDIARIYDLVPDGTKVTVVNQPYLLGWNGDRLLLQAYEPLVDDKRDWSDVPKALRQKTRKPTAPLWKKVAEHAEAIDWERVRAAAAEPRGIAIAVGPGPAPDLDAAIAQAPRVRNAIPEGANWNGVEDQYAGDPKFAKPADAGAETASTGP